MLQTWFNYSISLGLGLIFFLIFPLPYNITGTQRERGYTGTFFFFFLLRNCEVSGVEMLGCKTFLTILSAKKTCFLPVPQFFGTSVSLGKMPSWIWQLLEITSVKTNAYHVASQSFLLCVGACGCGGFTREASLVGLRHFSGTNVWNENRTELSLGFSRIKGPQVGLSSGLTALPIPFPRIKGSYVMTSVLWRLLDHPY